MLYARCNQISHRFKELGERVKESKSIFIEQHRAKLFRTDEQPALCTKIKAKSVKLPPGSVAYSPRTAEPGTHVICHLSINFHPTEKSERFMQMSKSTSVKVWYVREIGKLAESKSWLHRPQ